MSCSYVRRHVGGVISWGSHDRKSFKAIPKILRNKQTSTEETLFDNLLSIQIPNQVCPIINS